MRLGDLICLLEQYDPDLVTTRGFGTPDSYRGDYRQVAFEPASNVSVRSMLLHAEYAVSSTFEGYKGGHYTMHRDCDTYLAPYGETGPEITVEMVEYMLAGSDGKGKMSDIEARLGRLEEQFSELLTLLEADFTKINDLLVKLLKERT